MPSPSAGAIVVISVLVSIVLFWAIRFFSETPEIKRLKNHARKVVLEILKEESSSDSVTGVKAVYKDYLRIIRVRTKKGRTIYVESETPMPDCDPTVIIEEKRVRAIHILGSLSDEITMNAAWRKRVLKKHNKCV